MYDAVRASAEVAAELSYVIPLSEFEESTATARKRAQEAGRLGEWWNGYWKQIALEGRGKIRREK